MLVFAYMQTYHIVQLITPRVPAMAVSTVISSFSISFQLIRIAVIYYLTIYYLLFIYNLVI